MSNAGNGSVYPIKEFGPFSYFWPETPEGPWFKVTEISESQYYNEYRNKAIWPADIPLP